LADFNNWCKWGAHTVANGPKHYPSAAKLADWGRFQTQECLDNLRIRRRGGPSPISAGDASLNTKASLATPEVAEDPKEKTRPQSSPATPGELQIYEGPSPAGPQIPVLTAEGQLAPTAASEFGVECPPTYEPESTRKTQTMPEDETITMSSRLGRTVLKPAQSQETPRKIIFPGKTSLVSARNPDWDTRAVRADIDSFCLNNRRLWLYTDQEDQEFMTEVASLFVKLWTMSTRPAGLSA